MLAVARPSASCLSVAAVAWPVAAARWSARAGLDAVPSPIPSTVSASIPCISCGPVFAHEAIRLSISRGFAVDALGSQPKSGQNGVPESQAQADDMKRSLGAKGEKQTYDSGYVAPHPGMSSSKLPESVEAGYVHPSYDSSYLASVRPIHLTPKSAADHVGLWAVRLMRKTFDVITGYGPNMTEAKWLQRMIFLETVAGVPGMVAGMVRHLQSLRLMRRDMGWIHTLLEEAENERMHLLSFLELRKPGPLFRACVLLAQGVMFNLYFIVYLIWPKVCHAFVGYLEEEAVRTYTHALQDIDAGKLWANTPAPSISLAYWGLPAGSTMRDLILVIRADEACHSHVNHTLKTLAPTQPNPFALGQSQRP